MTPSTLFLLVVAGFLGVAVGLVLLGIIAAAGYVVVPFALRRFVKG